MNYCLQGDQVKTVVDKINSIKHWKKRAYGRHDLHDIGDEYELFIPHNELEVKMEHFFISFV